MSKHGNGTITQTEIARMAKVNRSDVSNYFAGRLDYVTEEKRIRIMKVVQQTEDGRMSQRDRILNHLMAGRELSPIEALQRFGCMRLSGRILELRRAGYNIETDMTNGYATYRMVFQ